MGVKRDFHGDTPLICAIISPSCPNCIVSILLQAWATIPGMHGSDLKLMMSFYVSIYRKYRKPAASRPTRRRTAQLAMFVEHALRFREAIEILRSSSIMASRGSYARSWSMAWGPHEPNGICAVHMGQPVRLSTGNHIS